MISYTLTLVYLYMMQDKMVSLLPHGTFKDSCSLGVVTRDKVTSAELTAFSVSANFNIISYDKPHLNPPPLAAPSYVSARLLGSSLNQDSVTCRHPYKMNPSDRSCTFLRNKLCYLVK